MASEVEICNLALVNVGADTITSLGDDSDEARACNLFYNKLRDMMLRGFLWNFAITRVELAAEPTTPVWEWAFSHVLPTDCLRVLKTDIGTLAESWVIEGRKLLADSTPVNIKYIFRETDPNQFDQLFQQMLSYRLAMPLAIKLAQNRALSLDMFNEFERTAAEARKVDSQEGTPEPITADEWEISRFAGFIPLRDDKVAP